jgi:dTDP-4-amino-4,6-dideoxygalactose transaminase
MKVPYVNLAAQHAPIKERLLDAIGSVLDHGRFILGDEVAEFERRFAVMCGVRHAVAVNSGTDALVLALKALGIGEGDEVITAPNSFVASAGCIALVGARPVFADVGADYNIDPALIEQAITPRTRAILPVHLTGRPADMDAIGDIARAHGLQVVEDCAQAVCAEYKGRRVGSFGSVGCFSLHPLKTLNACGDGGVITTNDDRLCEQFKTLRNIGLQTRDDCILWGHNSRLDTLQAAILMVKMEYVEEWTERRRIHAAFYSRHLIDLDRVQVPADKPHEKAVYHTFVIQADDRDRLRAHLAEKGVGTGIHYPVPIHLQSAAKGLGYRAGSFPVAERQAQRILSLPVYPELEERQLDHVVNSIYSFYR